MQPNSRTQPHTAGFMKRIITIGSALLMLQAKAETEALSACKLIFELNLSAFSQSQGSELQEFDGRQLGHVEAVDVRRCAHLHSIERWLRPDASAEQRGA